MSTQPNAFKGHAVAANAFASAVIDGFAAVKSNLAARSERRRVYYELSRMSERDLADIGIGRADIARAAGYAEAPALALSARR